MEQLFNLYSRLHDSEKVILDALITQAMKSSYKVNKLYKIICYNEYVSDSQASKSIYPDPNPSAFAHLKRKLLLLMYTVIGTDLELYNGSRMTYAVVKKRTPTIVSFSRELYIRGEFNLAVQELYVYYSKIKASKFLTSEKLVLLDQIMRFSGNNSLDLVKKKSVNLDYMYLSELQFIISRYNYIYSEVSSMKSQDINGSSEFSDRLSKILENCSEDLNLLSDDDKYKEALFSLLKVYHLCSALIGDFARAKEYAIRMDKLLESDLLGPQDSRGGIKMTMGNIETMSYRFKEAVNFYEKSLEVYCSTGNIYNISSALIRLIRIELLLGRMFFVEKYIESIKSYNIINYKELYYEYEYLAAVMLFIKRDYRRCMDCIIKLEYAYEFNNSFKIGLKMYEIMSLMFLEYYDIIPLKIDALRKFSYKTSGSVKVRTSLFLRVINSLQNSGFMKSINPKSRHFGKISLALKNSFDYKWNPLSFEICKFDKHLIDYWFSKGTSKENLQLYNPSDNPEQSSDEN